MREELREWLEEAAVRAGLSGMPSPARVALVAACCGLLIWAVVRWGTPSTDTVSQPVGASPARTASSEASTTRPSAPASVTVHVVGEVRHPGVYVLASGARACDAVERAGGMLGSAEQAGINLARVLTDGEQLVVPRKGQAAAGGAAPAGTGQPAAGGKVDLNTADAAALDALPGVGPATAKKIVDDRTANGPFRSVQDLMRVPGIGPAKMDALKDLVTVG